MSRVTKLAAGICGLGVVAVLTAPLVAQGPEGGGRHERSVLRMGIGGLPLHGLDLTDAQREQVRGIVSARQADFKAIGERLRTAHDAQRHAVTRVPVDENEIRARVSDASAVEADFAILRARIHEQVYQVLDTRAAGEGEDAGRRTAEATHRADDETASAAQTVARR